MISLSGKCGTELWIDRNGVGTELWIERNGAEAN